MTVPCTTRFWTGFLPWVLHQLVSKSSLATISTSPWLGVLRVQLPWTCPSSSTPTTTTWSVFPALHSLLPLAGFCHSLTDKSMLQVPELDQSSQPKPDFSSYLNKVCQTLHCVAEPSYAHVTTWHWLSVCLHPTIGTVSSIGRALTNVRRLRVRFPYCPFEIQGSSSSQCPCILSHALCFLVYSLLLLLLSHIAFTYTNTCIACLPAAALVFFILPCLLTFVWSYVFQG